MRMDTLRPIFGHFFLAKSLFEAFLRQKKTSNKTTYKIKVVWQTQSPNGRPDEVRANLQYRLRSKSRSQISSFKREEGIGKYHKNYKIISTQPFMPFNCQTRYLHVAIIKEFFF